MAATMKTDERQPLLGQPDSTDTSSKDDRIPKTLWIRNLLPKIKVTEPRYRFLPLIGCLLVLLNEGEYFFKQIGYYRAIEALYCIEYYNDVDADIGNLGKRIPERLCKLNDIQKKVATANGIIMVVRMTSAMIGTVPLGYLVDRIGRRFANVMHKVGTLIYTLCVAAMYLGYPTIPIWFSFLGGLGGLIGANFDLNLAVMLAAYTDAMTDTSQRDRYFFITTSMQYVGQVFWPLLAGKAINLDGQGGTSEVSLFISLGMATTGLLISLFLWPETIEKNVKSNAQTEPEQQGSEGREGAVKSPGMFALIRRNMESFWTNLQHSVCRAGAFNLILLAISIFLATSAIKAVDWIGLIQYPVIKFGWKYTQSTFAMAFQAVVYIFTYFFLLPAYRRLGGQLGLASSSISLIIMLLSLVFLEAGALFLGFSSAAGQFIAATCIYTLGAGMPAVMFAYIANLVEKSELGKLLAILSLFQVAGKVFASGVGPIIIKAGIDSGNESLKGSIFFFAAILFLFSASALGVVALRSGITKKAAEAIVADGEGGQS